MSALALRKAAFYLRGAEYLSQGVWDFAMLGRLQTIILFSLSQGGRLSAVLHVSPGIQKVFGNVLFNEVGIASIAGIVLG